MRRLLRGSRHQAPAIDVKGLPGDVARAGRQQTQDRPDDIISRCEPAHRNRGQVSVDIHPQRLVRVAMGDAAAQEAQEGEEGDAASPEKRLADVLRAVEVVKSLTGQEGAPKVKKGTAMMSLHELDKCRGLAFMFVKKAGLLVGGAAGHGFVVSKVRLLAGLPA